MISSSFTANGIALRLFNVKNVTKNFAQKADGKSVTKNLLLTKILSRCRRSSTGCLEWQGAVCSNNNYASITYQRKSLKGHRLVWSIYHAKEIPSSKVIMHTCDNPICLNIEHLKLGTQKENSLDCTSKKRQHAQKKTHCINGHEFSKENTRTRHSKGRPYRFCIQCRRVYDRAHPRPGRYKTKETA